MNKAKLLVTAMLTSVSCVVDTDSAFSQVRPSHIEEARAFFTDVAARSNNPVIASWSHEGLLWLEKEGGVHKVWMEVPFMRSVHNQLLVPASLNRQAIGTFLIDTGATHTVITPQMVEKLGITITPSTPRLSISTANGTVKVPVVKLEWLGIGKMERKGVEAIVQDFGDDPLFTGLIGMNFFKDLDFIVQGNRLVLGLPVHQMMEKTPGENI